MDLKDFLPTRFSKPAEDEITSVPWETYTVRKGDTLEQIAQRFGVTEKYLIKINALASKYHIVEGQRLEIRPQQKAP